MKCLQLHELLFLRDQIVASSTADLSVLASFNHRLYEFLNKCLSEHPSGEVEQLKQLLGDPSTMKGCPAEQLRRDMLFAIELCLHVIKEARDY